MCRYSHNVLLVFASVMRTITFYVLYSALLGAVVIGIEIFEDKNDLLISRDNNRPRNPTTKAGDQRKEFVFVLFVCLFALLGLSCS